MPTLEGQLPLGLSVHLHGAVAGRQSVKFSVVPESSDRATAVSGISGSSRPGLRALIAGSCQLVILPENIWAIVWASKFSSLMPGRLNAMLIGEMYEGILIAPCGPQAVTDRAMSSSLRNASDPANWVAPASSPARPAPEPTEAY